ncbi:MAG: hypothetical protein FJ319_03390 [SAR202 cluster bacterium]|nr:hypothetical protein [SAR202 cluster bacterium]
MGGIARVGLQFVSTAIVLILILAALMTAAGGALAPAGVMLLMAAGVFLGRRLLFKFAEGRLWQKEVAP